eukprot:4808945-Alexandrium_andersonii.AAC.1
MLQLFGKRCLGPELTVAVSRVLALRRCWHKQPGMRDLARHIWNIYCDKGHPAAASQPDLGQVPAEWR